MFSQSRPQSPTSLSDSGSTSPALGQSSPNHRTGSLLCSATPKQLPNEILQHVFKFLCPTDFNSARHTCHCWMQASLVKGLLRCMLRRGGWWSGVHSDLWSRENIVSEEWFLSRHLSRQCALAAGWTGNGVQDPATFADQEHGSDRCGLVQRCQADFTELTSGYGRAVDQHGPGLIFAVSVCDKYLLVAESGMIYVYALEEANLRPVASIVCPRRVLSMSMDTSASRFSVAALLDGRMGLVCDLESASTSNKRAKPLEPKESVEGSSIFTSGPYPISDHVTVMETEHCVPIFEAVNVRCGDLEATLHGMGNPVRYHQNFVNQTWNDHIPAIIPTYEDRPLSYPGRQHAVPVCNGPRTIYRQLCSEDDPPRSVAICPQQRCVAFGCAGGIELHWVDKQTTQDLHRWFPVSSPSDYLFFLNPRPGVDSTHKLRIISSIAHPDDRIAIHKHFSQYAHPAPSSWAYRNADSRSWRRTAPISHDHYRAIPLSDGYHHIFTDPTTSILHLGSDAPFGGSIRLIRKVAMIPPAPGMIPSGYAIGANLSEGARIVACFRQTQPAAADHSTAAPVADSRDSGTGDVIMLYCIPPDVFIASRTEHSIIHGCHGDCSRTAGSPSQLENSCDGDVWREWWPVGDDPILETIIPHYKGMAWPLKLRGIKLGKLESGCAALAVNETPELTVWVVAKDGRATAWVMGGISGRKRRGMAASLVVARDGRVIDREDSDDWEQDDSDMYDEYPGTFDDFDGEHASDREVDEAFGYTLDSQPGNEKRYVFMADEFVDKL